MVFITVKHGANEHTLFNQDCRAVTLLNAIRERCCEMPDAVIDLSDKDGNVKDLRKYPHMIAKEVLADREDFILLQVGENEKGKLVFTPLLENEEIVTKAFLDKLAKGSKRESMLTGAKGSKGSKNNLASVGGRRNDPSTSSASSFSRKSASSTQHKRK